MPPAEDVYRRDVSEALADADDTPTILDAFKKCGHDGSIVFTEAPSTCARS